ncbi:MAG: cytochrome c biogenesis protein CcdA [Anaerolineae bacterium]|nr:MAG: cytochrome c biogenesis protein CcdA [Anaerolineae bacterium]
MAGKELGLTAATPSNGLKNLASFVIPAALVLGMILALISLQSSAESSAADLATFLPIGFAFAAGMVASVNPCGFLLLPSYISFQIGTSTAETQTSPAGRRLGRALVMGLLATAGFVAVFALVGSVIVAGGQFLVGIFPFVGLAIGVLMVGLGIWLLLSKAKLGIMAASRLTITPKRNPQNIFLFGIVYAAGSLSCTLPIFLVVVGSSFATQGIGTAFGQFIGYALGMGIVLIAVTVASALAEGTISRWLKGLLPYLDRISAMFLVGAGAYLVYYWTIFADAIF